MNYLFDFYHLLLTPKQRQYLELYYIEDYALVEIAEKANVSRQAVYDNIKRSESILENYEEQLKMYDKFLERRNLLQQLQEMIEADQGKDECLQVIQQLEKIS